MDCTRTYTTFVLSFALFLCTACIGQPPTTSVDDALEETTQRDVKLRLIEHQTALGLSFAAPPAWNVQAIPAAAYLSPPDYAKDKEQYMFLLRFAPEESKKIGKSLGLNTLAKQFARLEPHAEVTQQQAHLQTKAGPGTLMIWDVPRRGWIERVALFATASEPWMVVLRASAPVHRMRKRTSILRRIFATVGLHAPRMNVALVDEWRRTRPIDRHGLDWQQTMRISADGSFQVTNEPLDTTAWESVTRIGRWTTDSDELLRYAGDSRGDEARLSNKKWRFTDDGRVLMLGEGDRATRWRRVAF